MRCQLKILARLLYLVLQIFRLLLHFLLSRGPDLVEQLVNIARVCSHAVIQHKVGVGLKAHQSRALLSQSSDFAQHPPIIGLVVVVSAPGVSLIHVLT